MSDVISETCSATRLAPPSMWKVVFHNDNYTPLDFVIHVMERLYRKSFDEASRFAMQVHNEGLATVGPYPRDIAQTKCLSTILMAQEASHPLLVIASPV